MRFQLRHQHRWHDAGDEWTGPPDAGVRRPSFMHASPFDQSGIYVGDAPDGAKWVGEFQWIGQAWSLAIEAWFNMLIPFFVRLRSMTDNVQNLSHFQGAASSRMKERPMSDETPMGQVIQIDEARIRDHLGEMVRGTVEETLNALLDAQADRLCNAQRYERSEAGRIVGLGAMSGRCIPRRATSA
jgi:hypothetical protein